MTPPRRCWTFTLQTLFVLTLVSAALFASIAGATRYWTWRIDLERGMIVVRLR